MPRFLRGFFVGTREKLARAMLKFIGFCIRKTLIYVAAIRKIFFDTRDLCNCISYFASMKKSVKDGLGFGLVVGIAIAGINFMSMRNSPGFSLQRFLLISLLTSIMLGLTWGFFSAWMNKRKNK